jgi:hypothetical protein
MASFISKNGVWTPANEEAINIKTGEVYKGKDREATKIIEQETGRKDGHIGMNAKEDPENIMRARQLGMSVEEFLNMNIPPTQEQIAAEKEKEEAVVTHRPKPGKKGVKTGHGDWGDPKL